MIIATHNGVFQADDVFAVATLLLIHPKARVIRTRDPKELASADIVVDVGGVYDPDTKRYDHHQRGRAGVRPLSGIPYSAFGLVWKHHQHWLATTLSSMAVEDATEALKRVEETLVIGIDATDNGFDLPHSPYALSISAVISQMNPTWVGSPEMPTFDSRFFEAVEFATRVLRDRIASEYATVKARNKVREAIDYSKRNDPRIILLDNGGMPWTDVVCAEAPYAQYVVFQAPDSTWMCQAVPDAPGSFGMRRALPEEWAGLRDQEFRSKTAVESAVFCHPGRFICGAGTKLDALKLANQAMMGKQ
jgi:uncharacterized UPF0160 family protein